MTAAAPRGPAWRPALVVAARAGIALVIPVFLFVAIYNPVQADWGATQQEVSRSMPGDDIQASPIMDVTRAITIDAPAERIWPWLAQIGYRRAGWYGYDSLDNGGVRSATELVPALQQIQVGTVIPILEGVDYRTVSIDPGHYLVISGGEDNMTFGLYPIDASHTRLVWRYRSIPLKDITSPFMAGQMLTAVLVDFIAVRENMLGIKARAEGASPPTQADQNLEIALWVGMFLAFLAAEIALVIRKDWASSVIASTLVGVAMVALVLIKPPTLVDAAVLLLTAIGLWLEFRPANALRAGSGAARMQPTT